VLNGSPEISPEQLTTEIYQAMVAADGNTVGNG
jgi:hypothetical protein